jgi:hypothetical protein
MLLSTVTFMKASPAVLATATGGAAAAASAAGAPEPWGDPATGGPPGGGVGVCADVEEKTHGEAIATAKAVANTIPAQLKIPAVRFRCDARFMSPPYREAVVFLVQARLAR